MTLEIVSPLVYTKVGVPITVSSVAQVRVSRCVRGGLPARPSRVRPGVLTVACVHVRTTWHSVPEALRVAASQFLDMTRAQIEGVAKQTLVHT